MGLAVQLNCARHCEPRRQNGQSKPFSRSRRAAGFLWYFLSLRKKVLPPSGRQPHRSRRSRRVKYRHGNLRHSCRALMQAEAFRSPLHPFGPSKEKCERPMGRKTHFRAGIGASSPRRWIFPSRTAAPRRLRETFLRANNRRGLHCRASARCSPELPRVSSFSFQHCTEFFPSRQDFPSSVR